MSGFGVGQGAGGTAVAVLRSIGEPGKASPIREHWEDGRGTVMVANRTREMRLSGMTRGAYGNVNHGRG
jgi:hypothetical protein